MSGQISNETVTSLLAIADPRQRKAGSARHAPGKKQGWVGGSSKRPRRRDGLLCQLHCQQRAQHYTCRRSCLFSARSLAKTRTSLLALADPRQRRAGSARHAPKQRDRLETTEVSQLCGHSRSFNKPEICFAFLHWKASSRHLARAWQNRHGYSCAWRVRNEPSALVPHRTKCGRQEAEQHLADMRHLRSKGARSARTPHRRVGFIHRVPHWHM